MDKVNQAEKVNEFFALVGDNQDDEARELFKSMAFPDGVTQPPSPTAQDYIDAGEWDSKVLVELYLVSPECCRGRIGSLEPIKMCAKSQDSCVTASHVGGKKVDIGITEVGWRIGAGGTMGAGVYSVPYLVDDEVGGPIRGRCKTRLMNLGGVGSGFKMPVAHWRMLFALYLEGITSKSESPSSEGVTSPAMGFGLPRVPKQPPVVETVMDSEDEGMSKDTPDPDLDGSDKDTPAWDEKMLRKLLEEAMSPMAFELEECRRALRLSESKYAGLESKYAGLETKYAGFRASVSKDSKDVVGRIGVLEHSSGDMRSQLQFIVQEVKDTAVTVKSIDREGARLSARVESGGMIHFHGHVFGSALELTKFCRVNRIRVGCSADGFLLMNIPSYQTMAEEESLKTRKGRADIKIGSGIESVFVSSFDTNFPAVLSPSKGAASGGETSSMFQVLKKLMKDSSAWQSDDFTDGVRMAIETSTTTCMDRISSFAVNAEAGLTPTGSDFCNKLISDSQRFVVGLADFITRFHDTHTKLSGMKPAALWDLCLEILAHIVEEIVRVRNVHVDSAARESAFYFWGMLRAWEIQQRYVKHKFLNDPALNGIFTRRALLRKDETLVQMEKDLRALQTKVAGMAKKSG